ncbi:MAG: VOC family protein [Gallionella sp.]|jgi:catechol 2,3-dioxygenase-like lactoylglutathione lyase family enzyme
MSDIGFTHVALPVRCLAASIDFYARYANMLVVHSRPGTAWVSDCTRPFAIVLMESTAEIKPLLPPAHLGVGIATRCEVDRLSQLAREQGYLIAGPEDGGPPVGYWAFIRDPDGHTLEIAYGQELKLAVERAPQQTHSLEFTAIAITTPAPDA